MKPIQFLSVVLLALCISVPALAKGPKPAPAPAPTPAYHSSGGSSSSMIHWSVSGPFQLLDGTAMFGAYVNGDYFIQHDISVGGMSGFWIGSSNSVTIWEIPIVATGKYHFAIANMPNWKPYAGLGLGLGIMHAGASVTVPGVGTVGGSETAAKFHGELKVGTAFQEGPGLMAEIKLGVVGSGFLFAPLVGYQF